MLKFNYFKIVVRNILRDKFYTFINISGLAIGIACTIFILLYIQDELGYDRYHKNYRQIFRVEGDFNISGKQDRLAASSFPIGVALLKEIPEVEGFVRFNQVGKQLFRYGEKEFYEEDIVFADSSVTRIFTHHFIQGTAERALTEPYSMIISQSMAKKYFGEEDPLGKMIISGSSKNYKVTGVFEDLPKNLHLRYEGIISMATLDALYKQININSLEPPQFWSVQVYTYVLLNKEANIEEVRTKLPAVYDKYMAGIGEQLNASCKLMLSPLAGIHLNSDLHWDLPVGNMDYIYVLSVVAAFLLLIACINYMNLSTARSSTRAKEVGMRKVVGADRSQLTYQFLSESIILSFIALIIAIGIVEILMPGFNSLVDKILSFGINSNPLMVGGIILITIIVGFVSGSYPSFYLSSFQPVVVLKGKTRAGKKSGLFRKLLVIIQFIISIVMIISTLIVANQLDYIKTKDIGFNKENILLTSIRDTSFVKKLDSFKKELNQNPNITEVSTANGRMGNQTSKVVMLVEQNDGKMEEHALNLMRADYDYVTLMQMKIIKGRDFNKDMKTDPENSVLVNEALIKKFQWGNSALGRKIHVGFDIDKSGGQIMKITGIIKDFNYESLKNMIDPLVIFCSDEPNHLLHIKMASNESETLEFIKNKWESFNPNYPFDYVFLKERIDELYADEAMLNKIFTYASALCIFIALLGLLGLSSFIAEQRYKEIGIRKVLGAVLGDIIKLLYREFLLLILIAYIPAIIISYFLMQKWLDIFAYHTDLHWLPFVLGGLFAFIIATLTISFHIFKAAKEDPVNAIMYE